MKKVRLDLLLVQRNLADSRSRAQRLIMAGQVRVNGELALKPAQMAPIDAEVTIDFGPLFVSRGGEKLEAALNQFGLHIEGWICADVGASTGGFTDCLLQHGAGRVYAIDVGQGILHWKLRQDARVVVMERTNARFLTRLPEPVALVTIDASFISLKLLLPVVRHWFAEAETTPPQGAGRVIALIKPQFEAGRRIAAKGEGVIRDSAVHREVLLDVLSNAQELGYSVHGLMCSPLLGPKGNKEFLAQLVYPADRTGDIEDLIDRIMGGESPMTSSAPPAPG